MSPSLRSGDTVRWGPGESAKPPTRHMRIVWRIPPPPIEGLRATDGAGLLKENPGSLGILLWDLARQVILWADTPHEELAELSSPAFSDRGFASLLSTGGGSPVESAFRILARMFVDPVAGSRLEVGLACRRIATWAEAEDASHTAFVFALAAAHALPGDAQSAYQVGRLARRGAHYERATTWLTRALLLGRQAKDWDSYGAALAGMGNLYVQRGDYPRARKYHLRCLRAARRYGLRSLEGAALHNLCGVAIEVGRMEEVHAYARAAYEVWGPDHMRLPMLAHDVAYAWMGAGYFDLALQVFHVVLPHYRRTERVLVLADICRASAGIGDAERFERAWKAAWRFIGELSGRDHVAQGLLDMARGGASLRQWQRAERAAGLALALATEREESRIRVTAGTVLEAIRAERSVEFRSRPPAQAGALARRLAGDLTESLARSAAAGT